MIEGRLQQDGCEVYYLDGLWSRVVVATFDTPKRASAWLAVWQERAALEAERDALAARLARVEAVLADLYSHITGMYEMQDEWSDSWDDELSDIHATERWATALRAALADPDPAPDGPPVGERIYTLPSGEEDLPNVCDRCYEPLTQYVIRDNSALCLRCAGIATRPDYERITPVADPDAAADDEDGGGAQHTPPMHWRDLQALAEGDTDD